MTVPQMSQYALRVADLTQRGSTPFEITPTPEEMRDIATQLSLSGLSKLRFLGAVTPFDEKDWQLQATLGASVVQPCVATLHPVRTRIDIDVNRLFLADYSDPDEPEAEMPDDETVEPLGPWIDPWQIMVEALSLALPLYPRAEGTKEVTINVTEPGKTAMTDDDAKPFAGLAALKSQLEDGSD